MNRVHPTVVVAWLHKAAEKFGHITPENSAEVSAWIRAQIQQPAEMPETPGAERITRDWQRAAAGDWE